MLRGEDFKLARRVMRKSKEKLIFLDPLQAMNSESSVHLYASRNAAGLDIVNEFQMARAGIRIGQLGVGATRDMALERQILNTLDLNEVAGSDRPKYNPPLSDVVVIHRASNRFSVGPTLAAGHELYDERSQVRERINSYIGTRLDWDDEPMQFNFVEYVGERALGNDFAAYISHNVPLTLDVHDVTAREANASTSASYN